MQRTIKAPDFPTGRLLLRGCSEFQELFGKVVIDDRHSDGTRVTSVALFLNFYSRNSLQINVLIRFDQTGHYEVVVNVTEKTRHAVNCARNNVKLDSRRSCGV